eukprot:CAMPEP_0198115904 /NCGR_PEP_ID=MMETSP1442-20131203/7939_1 /TAXON_ID= /ORGANISM="Craspedostauros australis, Strain CCMP3328" /LENGTH=166 /DNA_ID=CAMNT_0043773509 /DNA_START=77 /DNA_END=577 /DNA_ORIENTATION=+
MKFTSSILSIVAIASSTTAFTTGPAARSQHTALQVIDPTAVTEAANSGVDFGAVAGGVGGLGAAVAAAVGFATKSSEKPSKAAVEEIPEPEAIDVSIPYNAAAQLAFDASALEASEFATFEEAYLAKTVAEVTLKKMQRDAALFETSVVAKAVKAYDELIATTTKE